LAKVRSAIKDEKSSRPAASQWPVQTDGLQPAKHEEYLTDIDDQLDNEISE
jgi:hypothetical protein